MCLVDVVWVLMGRCFLCLCVCENITFQKRAESYSFKKKQSKGVKTSDIKMSFMKAFI